jgi:protein disulfide-isomerase A6
LSTDIELFFMSAQLTFFRFYAPWCGHCQNLKPAYEKAAKNLAGLAKVAAVNCDEDSNKAFCGQMGVQGFPTLKIVKPGPKPGRPMVEDYKGPRNTKGIVDAVVDKIPNHVKRLQDKDLDAWLSTDNDTAKAILFTEKATTSALLRAVAIDFLGKINVAQIRNKENAAVEMFEVSAFPTLVLLPGGAQTSMVYDGEMKKEAIVAFLSQIVPPNPDPAPKSPKVSPSKKAKAAKSATSSSSAFSKASASHKSADASEAAASGSTIVLEDFDAFESPKPIVPPAETPIAIPDLAPPILTLATPAELTTACLGPKTGTCVLALLPSLGVDAAPLDNTAQALESLATIADKHVKRRAKCFPFYAIPAENEAAKLLRSELGLKSETELEIIAVNGKRNWWRHFGGEDTGLLSLESFIDTIKLGEGKKEQLPDGVISQSGERESDHHGEL